MPDLEELADGVASRVDFVRFLDALRADLRKELARPDHEVAWGAGEWAHPDLEGFLDSLGAWLTDTAEALAMSDRPLFDRLGPEVWQAFATFLMAARSYE